MTQETNKSKYINWSGIVGEFEIEKGKVVGLEDKESKGGLMKMRNGKFSLIFFSYVKDGDVNEKHVISYEDNLKTEMVFYKKNGKISSVSSYKNGNLKEMINYGFTYVDVISSRYIYDGLSTEKLLETEVVSVC